MQHENHPGTFQGNLRRQTLETTADRQKYDEAYGNNNPHNNQLYLHILNPHLPSHFCSLLLEILSLPHSISTISTLQDHEMWL